MPLFEIAVATRYVLDLLTESEELKKLPGELVDASVQWVKSWFLTPDDPKAAAKLEDPNKPIEVKTGIVVEKLTDLQQNPQFVQELAERIAALETAKKRLKNVVDNTEIDVIGNVHIGDSGASTGDDYDQKNVIKGSTIKAGGNFRLGDDVIAGNQQVHIEHNHYYAPPPQQQTTPSPTPPATGGQSGDDLRTLLDAKLADQPNNHLLIMLSGRLHDVERQMALGILDSGDYQRERNRIRAALLQA